MTKQATIGPLVSLDPAMAATTAHTLHAPESRSERARACPPVSGCPDLDPTWPGPDGNPRGPVRCTSFPACRCGEDEEDEDWPPTNTLRAMRLCPRCERPMVDHDDGACPKVTADTVTDEQLLDFADLVRALTVRALGEDGLPPSHLLVKRAKADLCAAINAVNARANGGR